MLIEFRVENHRSIRDEQVLSMEATRIGDESDARPRAVENHASKLLPVVAIYGANGSGKSNVLDALAYMKAAVSLSYRMWGPDEGVPRDPFAWGEKREQLSLYEVEVIVDSLRYQYGFTCNDDVILEEWIYAWPDGNKQSWLARDGENFKFGGNLKGENKAIEKLTRPNALYLSTAAQNKHAMLSPLFKWFRSIQEINLDSSSSTSRRPDLTQSRYYQRELMAMLEPSGEVGQLMLFTEKDESVLEQFKAMLRAADLGIVDVRLNRDGSSSNRPRRGSLFELKHQCDSDDAWLPLDEESRGTKTLFRLALPILHAIRTGVPLLVDELEASMHPMLADLIVRQFNDPEINTRNAQLIFSTHDTNLLGTLVGEPALRRDQVWLTEKGPGGATVLYPLTDYKPRKEENIERGYIQGRYGAIPFLGHFRVPDGVGE